MQSYFSSSGSSPDSLLFLSSLDAARTMASAHTKQWIRCSCSSGSSGEPRSRKSTQRWIEIWLELGIRFYAGSMRVFSTISRKQLGHPGWRLKNVVGYLRVGACHSIKDHNEWKVSFRIASLARFKQSFCFAQHSRVDEDHISFLGRWIEEVTRHYASFSSPRGRVSQPITNVPFSVHSTCVCG